MKQDIILFIAAMLIICAGTAACKKTPSQQTHKTIAITTTADRLEYHTYGQIPGIYWSKALRDEWKQYGVKVVQVAGCVMTDSLHQAIDQHNVALYRQLNVAEGQVNKRVYARYQLYRQIIELLQKDTAYLRLDKEARAKGTRLDFELSTVMENLETDNEHLAVHLFHYKSGPNYDRNKPIATIILPFTAEMGKELDNWFNTY